MILRDAVAADIEAVTAIYNAVLLSSTAIYNDTPVTLEDRLAYWQSRVAQGYPLLVAVDDEGAILGYATFGDFRSWPGYRFTVEGTIHIREGVRGKGIGTALLTQLTARARACGKHVMVAGVDSTNTASIGFLTRFGFTSAGVLHEVGFKFGRYLDLHFLEYRL
ncbi:GNAT family N-acetyltransferase [Granulicella sp. 5B5]|uniref:GNAT family N-acetyltransferase n=1 Tax=Granulicella sp. 5B5 TaxID=1617967 RepID=UPI0015F4F953|nr:GNAT family N-acetyltransferase [Granulicella sp. 5B5]QMV18588.1 GNAT family N-acetyltransferase [Granulicella sp. 5B5]